MLGYARQVTVGIQRTDIATPDQNEIVVVHHRPAAWQTIYLIFHVLDIG